VRQARERFGNEQEKSKLENALAQLKLEYAPQEMAQNSRMSEQNLLAKQLENQFYAPNMRSQIGLRNIQAGLLPEQLAFEKTKEERVRQRFDANKRFLEFFKAMPQENQKLFFAQNPELMTELLSDVGNQAYSNIGLAPGEERFPEVPKQMTVTPGQVEAMGGTGNLEALPQALENLRPLPQNPALKRFNTEQKQIDQQRLAAEIAANNSVTPPPVQNQLAGAIQLEHYIDSPAFMEAAIGASKYAGAAGKGKEWVDRLIKNDPDSLAKYDAFKNIYLKGLEARFMQLEGLSSSEGQREEIHNMSEKTMFAFNSDPENFMKQLENLKKMLREVGKSVEKSANPYGFESRLPEPARTIDLKTGIIK
jgi:hypothetical protein